MNDRLDTINETLSQKGFVAKPTEYYYSVYKLDSTIRQRCFFSLRCLEIFVKSLNTKEKL